MIDTKSPTWNRQEFLKLSLATLTGVALSSLNNPSEASDLPPASTDYYHGLKVGMHTYTLRNFNFDQAVKITRDLGLKYIGFNPKHVPLDSTPEQLARARKTVADAGLTLMAIGVIGFGKKDPDPRKVFEMAKAAGFHTISTSAGPERLNDLDRLVAEYGIRLAIHNHGPKDTYATPEILAAAIKDHHVNIGACVDCGHYQRAGADPAHAIRLLGRRVYDVHLKDVDVAEEKGKSIVMGTGVVDVKGVLKALLEIKFQGNAAIEYEADPANPVPGIEKSLAHIRKCLDEISA